jgi:MFS family permease
VLIPQFVQAPASTGYGFGSSVTQAGLFLLPSTIVMLVAAPLGGRLSGRVGSKVPLVIGTVLTMVCFLMLALAHSTHWEIYLASAVLGVGVGFAFASMANLIVEAVRADQTGVATGMNAVMRTIGGAVGGQVAASILAASVAADGYPGDSGYTVSFLFMTAVLAAAVVASFVVPGRVRGRAHQISLAEPQASLE